VVQDDNRAGPVRAERGGRDLWLWARQQDVGASSHVDVAALAHASLRARQGITARFCWQGYGSGPQNCSTES